MHRTRIALFCFIMLITALPLFVLAGGHTGTQDTGLIPCGQADEEGRIGNPCDFDDLMVLINNLIEFTLFYLAMPIAAVMFVYAGWLYISSGGDTGKVKKAHGVFITVVVGFGIALAAWLIVDLIVSGLVEDPNEVGGQFLGE